MEASPISEMGKRKRRKRKVSGGSPKLCKNIGVFKPVNQKKNGQKVKQIAEHYVTSFIPNFYDQQVPKTGQTDCSESRQSFTNILEQTVDLCEGDSVSEIADCSVVPSVETEPKNKFIVDLSSDISEPSEVIDLTGPLQPLKLDVNRVNSEPTVIDLIEDESKEESNFTTENDEIFVIGTFSKQSTPKKKYGKAQSPDKWRNFDSLVNCNAKLKRKYLRKRCLFDKINSQNKSQPKRNWFEQMGSSHLSKVAKVGENIYVNSPVVLPSSGLRPIIIDGSNVAFVHSQTNFCCKRLEICINYFKEKGHKVTAFVPQFRINSHKSDDPQLLRKLERRGDVVLTPSKRVDGKNIVPYDDRFIVQAAVLNGGIIITRDNYNDLLGENPAWSETIKYRTLAFTWVGDVLMFPTDPLGVLGPSLEEFLRFH